MISLNLDLDYDQFFEDCDPLIEEIVRYFGLNPKLGPKVDVRCARSKTPLLGLARLSQRRHYIFVLSICEFLPRKHKSGAAQPAGVQSSRLVSSRLLSSFH